MSIQYNTHVQRCQAIVAAVDNLSVTETYELFKILHQKQTMYTRNNNGVFLNLTWLDESILSCVEDYVKFCTHSRAELLKFESICDVLNKKHSHKPEVTDNVGMKKSTHAMEMISNRYSSVPFKRQFMSNSYSNKSAPTTIKEQTDENQEETTEVDGILNGVAPVCNNVKMSSSMRFSLLKKRYAKQCSETSCESDLRHDSFACT